MNEIHGVAMALKSDHGKLGDMLCRNSKTGNDLLLTMYVMQLCVGIYPLCCPAVVNSLEPV